MYIKGFSIYSKINPPKKYEKPQISLHYLAELSANNYTIVINPNVPDPFRNKIMTFDGYAYKKRSRNTFTVVDSWSHIKNEHWKMFRKQYTLPSVSYTHLDVYKRQVQMPPDSEDFQLI